MGRYLSPSPAKLQAKGVTSVRSRVVNLKELRPDLDVAKMAAAMELAFSQVYDLPVESMDASGLNGDQLNALYQEMPAGNGSMAANFPLPSNVRENIPGARSPYS